MNTIEKTIVEKRSNYMNQELILKFTNYFSEIENYEFVMDNLWQTRAGLTKLIEDRKELRPILLNQCIALNEIISILLEGNNYHPRDKFL